MKKIKYDKGIKIALLSSVLVALLSIEMKVASSFASTPVLVIFTALPTVIFYPIFMKSARRRLKLITQSNRVNILSFCIFNTLSLYLIVAAYRVGDVGRAIAVYQGMSLVSLPLGIIVLKERKRIWWKTAGAGLAFVGILLLR